MKIIYIIIMVLLPLQFITQGSGAPKQTAQSKYGDSQLYFQVPHYHQINTGDGEIFVTDIYEYNRYGETNAPLPDRIVITMDERSMTYVPLIHEH